MKMLSRGHHWRRHAHRGMGIVVPLIAICLAGCCIRRRCKRKCHERRAAAAAAAKQANNNNSSNEGYPGTIAVAVQSMPQAIAMPVVMAAPVAAVPVVASAPSPLVYSHDPQPSYAVAAVAPAAASRGTQVEMRTFPSSSSSEPIVEGGSSMYPKVSGNGYARVGSDDAI